MAEMITVTLVCFSQVRHHIGSHLLPIELPLGSTAGDAEADLRSRLPEHVRALPMRVAVNQEFAERSAVLQAGDEVVFMPPMQGG